MTKVIILTGLSGSGKDTLSSMLQESTEVQPITPHSTRLKRDGEVEGNPYYFVTTDQFQEMEKNGEFIETASYLTKFNGIEDTAHYGTAFTSISDNSISIVTIGVQAGIVLKQKLGDSAYLVYVQVSDDERERRAKLRGSFDQLEWDNRLSQDQGRFVDGLPDDIDRVIDNSGDVADTYLEILDTYYFLKET